MIDRLADARHRARRRRHPAAGASTIRRRPPAGRGSRARWSRPATSPTIERGVRSLARRAAGRRSCRASGASPDEVFARIHDAGGIASLAHPGLARARRVDCRLRRRRPRRARGLSHRSRRSRRPRATSRWPTRSASRVIGGSDYHADDAHGGGGPGQRVAARRSTTKGCCACARPDAPAHRRPASVDFFVEQHVRIREQRAQFARLEQVIRRRRSASAARAAPR